MMEDAKNVRIMKEGNDLVIRVDMSKKLGPSASGKSILIASTGGGMSIDGTNAKINLSVYTKA